MQLPHEHFFVWGDDPYGCFIELGEIVPQLFWGSPSFIEQASGGIFFMTVVEKLVYEFFH